MAHISNFNRHIPTKCSNKQANHQDYKFYLNRNKSKLLNYYIEDTLRSRIHRSFLYILIIYYTHTINSLLSRVSKFNVFKKIEAQNNKQEKMLLIECASSFFREKKERLLDMLAQEDGINNSVIDEELAKIEFCLFCIVSDPIKNFKEKIYCIKSLINPTWIAKYKFFLDSFKEKKLGDTIPFPLINNVHKLDINDLTLDANYTTSKPSKLSFLLKIYDCKEEDCKINLLEQMLNEYYLNIITNFTKKYDSNKISNNLNELLSYLSQIYKILVSKQSSLKTIAQVKEIIEILNIYYLKVTKNTLLGLYYLVEQYCRQIERIINLESNIINLAEGNLANFIEFVHLELAKLDANAFNQDTYTTLIKLMTLMEATRIKYKGFTRNNTSVFDLSYISKSNGANDESKDDDHTYIDYNNESSTKAVNPLCKLQLLHFNLGQNMQNSGSVI